MFPSDLQLTSDVFWGESLVAAFADAVLVLVLSWRIKPAEFRRLKWTLAATSAGAWGVFGLAMVWGFWDLYYRYIFPESMRWLVLSDVLLYFGIGLGLWWLAERLPGNPVLNFGVLGGLESVPEHLYGIYGLGILEKVPLLEGLTPLPVLVFAVFEYIFYWSIVLGLALLVSRTRGWWRRARAMPHPGI